MLAQLVPAWVSASAADSTTTHKGSPVGTIVLFLALIAIVVLFAIRARRRTQTAQIQQAEIAIGSTIVTRAGLIATLIDRNDDYVVLQLDDGTRARFVPQAVARLWYEPEPDDGPGSDPDTEPPGPGGSLAD